MNYEEKYKDALERMRWVIIPPETKEGLQALKETVFPELRESEDEKVRKEIVAFIQWAADMGSVPNEQLQAKRPGEWLAYLEKQKEQTAEWSEDDKLAIQNIVLCLSGSFISDGAKRMCLEWFNRRRVAFQQKQPYLKPSEADEQIKNTIAKCLACGKRDGVINDEENILCLDWMRAQKETEEAVSFVYPSPEAWKFAPAGTKFSEDVLLVCEDREPRISRCAVNNGYYLPTSRILPPESVTDKLRVQYGDSHVEQAPGDQNKTK